MDHIGIDVHKKESQLCILAEGGERIEWRIRTEPERFATVLGDRPRARILIEACGVCNPPPGQRCLGAGHRGPAHPAAGPCTRGFTRPSV